MATKEAVKKNISGMQVLKTLQLLLEDNYTMSELIERLNKKEKRPIFNNHVVSKYINTCRYCGFEIHKIHNKYFVAKLPFGLEFTSLDLDLLAKLQEIGLKKLANTAYKNFNSFIMRLNKFSNKDITTVSTKTIDFTFELFEKAILEKRKIMLRLRNKTSIDCIPLEKVESKSKTYFKILHKNKERQISIERISAIELLGKIFIAEDGIGERVEFKLTGELAKRYSPREHEEVNIVNLPEYIKVVNIGEDKDKLISRLLRYDKCCEILSPKSYREEMKLIIDQMLANYGE